MANGNIIELRNFAALVKRTNCRFAIRNTIRLIV